MSTNKVLGIKICYLDPTKYSPGSRDADVDAELFERRTNIWLQKGYTIGTTHVVGKRIVYTLYKYDKYKK